jgi:uncharacterized membrane protein
MCVILLFCIYLQNHNWQIWDRMNKEIVIFHTHSNEIHTDRNAEESCLTLHHRLREKITKILSRSFLLYIHTQTIDE